MNSRFVLNIILILCKIFDIILSKEVYIYHEARVLGLKLKYDFIINEVAGQLVAVAVNEGMSEFNGFIKMNDIGAEIFEILKEDVTIEQVIEKMLAKHPEATEEEARDTITDFISELKKNNLIA